MKIVRWERPTGLRLLLGLPLLERKVRKVLPGLWFADVSPFEGSWLRAAGQLQEAPAILELLQSLINFTRSPSGDVKERRKSPFRICRRRARHGHCSHSPADWAPLVGGGKDSRRRRRGSSHAVVAVRGSRPCGRRRVWCLVLVHVVVASRAPRHVTHCF